MCYAPVRKPATVMAAEVTSVNRTGVLVLILVAFALSTAAAYWLLKPGEYAAPPPGYIGPGAPDSGVPTNH
jgi:hypothetical protein